jgi:predicted DNA-binding protein (MmcQ/YjbR family)
LAGSLLILVSTISFTSHSCNHSVLWRRQVLTEVYRHSKKMYAWETGPIDDLAIVLLCGESEFKVSTTFHVNTRH